MQHLIDICRHFIETMWQGTVAKVQSRFIAALAVFASINVVASLWYGHFKQNIMREDAALQDFLRAPEQPDVAILGSSVAASPFFILERTENPALSSIRTYSRVRWLEARLRSTNGPISVFSLANMGQLLSDDYFTVDAYLSSEHRPKLLIVMISPRDCYDYSYPRPADGRIFRHATLSQFLEYHHLYMPTLGDKIEFFAAKIDFLYGKRERLQIAWEEIVSSILRPFYQSPEDAAQTVSWSDGVRQWKQRLSGFTVRSAETQLQFLTEIGNKCAQRNIPLLLVNMPRDTSFSDLMPPEFIRHFDETAAAVAMRYHINYIDLNRSAEFSRRDFCDPVHLDEHGAMKLAGILLPLIQPYLRSHR